MRLLIALCLACFAATSEAANFSAGPPDRCQLRMDGQIASGDADRFAAMLGAFDLDDGETSDQMLCVSGPGGSFSDALKIGAILIDKGIGTRLEAGQECLSACAVLFMMGSQIFYEGIGDGQNANRVMHATSRLGFHRPELRLETGGQYDTAAIEKSFDLAIEATLEFVRLANNDTRQSTMVPSDMLQKIFERRGEDYFYIETTGQSVRWDIRVEGLNLPRAMGARGAWHACNNLGVWPVRYEDRVFPYEDTFVEQVANPAQGPIYAVHGAYVGDADHFCLLQYRQQQGGPGALYGCGMLGQENRTIGARDCMSKSDVALIGYVGSDARAFLPADTRLAALAEGRGPPQSALPPGAAAFRAQCATKTGRAFVTNVQNFTSLRRLASIGTDKLEEVRLNAEVRIVTPGMAPDIGGISTRCSRICWTAAQRSLSAGESAQLDACFNSNAFWYRVRTPGEKIGYLSGKFLRN